MINYKLWTKLFHRDPSVLGTTHILNGTGMTLVGIMPPRFQIGGFDLWMPLKINRETFVPGAGMVSNEIWVVGHLKPGVTPETAAVDLQTIAVPFQRVDPIYFPSKFRIVVHTLNSQSVDSNFKVGLFALTAAVIVLLLIACSNVANLLLTLSSCVIANPYVGQLCWPHAEQTQVALEGHRWQFQSKHTCVANLSNLAYRSAPNW